jgi:hypothetical protein
VLRWQWAGQRVDGEGMVISGTAWGGGAWIWGGCGSGDGGEEFEDWWRVGLEVGNGPRVWVGDAARLGRGSGWRRRRWRGWPGLMGSGRAGGGGGAVGVWAWRADEGEKNMHA